MKLENVFCHNEQSDNIQAEISQPLVSVIVPVYKVEDVLARCLGSLCRQSLRHIEIILVDDASPDRCGEVCEKYAAEDTRFKVIHHPENRGLSVARNTGIAHASADYLMFVDSDDWVHEDFCKEAYECAVYNQADLVMFRFQSKNSYLRFGWKDSNLMQNGIKTRLEAMELIETSRKGVGPAVWNKLYRKELFQNISFPPGYFHEDSGATYKIVWKASRIYFLNKVLYNYCYHGGSISTLKAEKSLRDWNEMLMKQYQDLSDWGYPQYKLDQLLKNIALWYCIKKKPDDSDIHYKRYADIICSSKDVPENFRWEKKVLFVLFKYCRPLFEIICRLHNLKVY